MYAQFAITPFHACVDRNSYDSHSGGEKEIQRTMLELLTQLDGFDERGDVKVPLMHAQPFNFPFGRHLSACASARV